MRPSIKATLLIALVMALSVSPCIGEVQARSVHSTTQVDIFPQGTLDDAGLWRVGAESSFTHEAADFTESMVAVDRLTMLHARRIHLDTMTVWMLQHRAMSSSTSFNRLHSTSACSRQLHADMC